MAPSLTEKLAVADDDLLSLDFTIPSTPCETSPMEPELELEPESEPEAAQAPEVKSQAQQACHLLDAAMRAGEDFGAEAECAWWGLLLDLYQATARREDFEAAAIEFARRFEKSPPAWIEIMTVDTAVSPGKPVLASLAGTLSARVEEPLKQVLNVGMKNPLRIDLSRITDADDRGCALLLAALDSCRRHGTRCRIVGAGHLAELLAGKVQQGTPIDEHIWLLLLELHQRLGNEEAFEDAALAYAVSFELSPPSWDTARIGDGEN